LDTCKCSWFYTRATETIPKIFTELLASEIEVLADDVDRGADPDFELEVADAPTNLKICTSIQDVFMNTNTYFGEEVPYSQ